MTKTITVIETTVVKTGTSSGGKDWTLYEVTAVDTNGAPIEEKLKSFDRLDGTVEVEVEKTEHEKYGVSYMLKLPRAGGAGGGGAQPQPAPSPGARLGPKVDELRDRIDLLEQRMDQVVAAISAIGAGLPVPEVPTKPTSGATF